ACIAQFGQWNVTSQGAGGELPVPGVYGVPEQWPHVRELYEQAGFVHTGHTEAVYLARLTDLPRLDSPPLAGLEVSRTVGLNGTRLSAVLAGEVIGYIEVEIRAEGERLSRQAGWADVGNLRVSEEYRRRKVATWLLSQAASWLELAHVDRLLDYSYSEGRTPDGQADDEHRAFLNALPFTLLTRTRRSWARQPGSSSSGKFRAAGAAPN
ncbi:MAG: GNAT family N-acetyltransferase, partial [Actinobacteria bacterium]|nr:GNAT family N-acetyltransferase [Actinomycetota bacterium]